MLRVLLPYLSHSIPFHSGGDRDGCTDLQLGLATHSPLNTFQQLRSGSGGAIYHKIRPYLLGETGNRTKSRMCAYKDRPFGNM